MDPYEQSRWRPTRKHLLWAGVVAALAVALAFFAIVVCGYLFEWKWTGLPKRTLWDWLNLLIVPIVLAVGGYLFTRSENRSTQAAAERSTQDDALQAYLDYMSDLLIPNKDRPSLYKARAGDNLSSVARSRTLAVLSRLDGNRRASVVKFLHEADLIERNNPVLSLARANLRGASLSGNYLYGIRLALTNLGGANLSRADLGGADLGGANLADAHLRGANLRRANLRGADLGGADLGEADLDEANLPLANLAGAYLGEARLIRADLHGADLRGADLRGARGRPRTWEEQANSLEGATMPDGRKYKAWRKDRGGLFLFHKNRGGR